MILGVRGESSPQKAWARVCAFAWVKTEVLQDLRKDPKGTIEEIAKGEDGKYKADSATAEQANTIIQLSEEATERYSGYLPIPFTFGGLEKRSSEELKELLLGGITGAFRFDEEADLWADVLHQAWNDDNLLKEIRKDPLGKLPRANELKDKEYGIFPMPEKPRGLEKLEIEELENFLSDEDNVPHLGGIMPPGT